MDIDKKELSERFELEDWEFFFKKVSEITNFILIQKFKVLDPEIRQDIIQECNIAFLKKIHKGQVDASKNIYSFIWQSSLWRIKEIFRKEANRNRIAQINYFEEEEMLDYFHYSSMLEQNKETLELMGVV